MALVTVQRSPSPSTEHDLDTISSEDTTDGKSHLKKSLSESYFTFKGAALILPHTECSSRKSSKKSHGGEIQDHLQAMLLLLRTEDQVKIAVRLEDVPNSMYKRYITVVSTRGRQDTEEAVILGMDCRHGEAVIGLVLPVWLGLKIQLEGDGSFRLCTDEQAYLFNPVSVQAMWSAIQSLVKVLHRAEEMKYIRDGLSHTWVEYYRSRIDYTHVCRNHHWNVEGVQVFAPYILNEEDECVKIKISKTLKEVMLLVDLDEVTCRALRLAVEENLGYSIKEHKSFFDEEMLRIFGQMDAPSKILDYLYLGSEWNASNLDELKEIGIGYILNVTKEIDNFYTGNFHYFTIRVHDVPESDLLKHWDKTFKFIAKARANGSKVLVHCKMGISRSGSTVMAYLMKENRWSVEEAFKFVKERRSVVNPNSGFMEQLHMYEAILSASNKREYFRTKAAAAHNEEDVLKEGLDPDQDCVLGDSLMNVFSEDWNMMMMPSYSGGDLQSQPPSTLEEDMEQLHYGSRLLPLGPDLEGTESRSGDSLEESLPDIPSPPLLLTGNNNPATATTSLLSDLKSSDADDIDPVLSSTSPGLSRIKPDSFWIRQETLEEDSKDDNEMMDTAEATTTMTTTSDLDAISESQSCLSLTGGKMDMKQSQEKTNLCPSSYYQGGVAAELYPTCLSTSDSKVFVKDYQPSSSSPLTSNVHTPSPPGALFNPTQSSSLPNDDGLSNVSYLNTISAGSSDKMTDNVSGMTINTQAPPLQADSFCAAAGGATACNSAHKIHNISNIRKSENNLPSAVDSQVENFRFATHHMDDECYGDGSKSVQHPKEETGGVVASSVPHRGAGGKVESGVRDYFLREKIPWHPGKVQKMREGIDRHGAIGDLSDERNEVECVVGCVGEKASAADSRELMEIDRNKIVLEEEIMEVSSVYTKDQHQQELMDGDGAEGHEEDRGLSLYEKEEIPLEPGTVLRTRLEIEERHRSSTTGDGGEIMSTPLTSDQTSPSKPVLRTSSLKTMKESQASSSSSFLPPPLRRVSCGPIMEPFVPLTIMDDDPVMEEARGEIDEGQWLPPEKNVHKSKMLDFMSGMIDLAPCLNTESSTDPMEDQDQENSGLVKSFVRKLENNPADLKITENLYDDNNETAVPPENEVYLCRPPPNSLLPFTSLPLTSDSDTNNKLDLGFNAGESNTDCTSLLGGGGQDSSSEITESSVVKHLVGQFEINKSPEHPNKATAISVSDSSDGAQNRTVPFGESEFPASVAMSDNNLSDSSTRTSKNIGSFPSFPALVEGGGQGLSLSFLPSLSAPSSSLPSRLYTKGGNDQRNEDVHKKVWNPHEQTMTTAEDIRSLRRRFEIIASTEDYNRNSRRAVRPKSVERMGGGGRGGASKKDIGEVMILVEDEGKGEGEASLRQVSEEGRKVRRLHGKSHPLSRLSQTRGGVSHSSM